MKVITTEFNGQTVMVGPLLYGKTNQTLKHLRDLGLQGTVHDLISPKAAVARFWREQALLEADDQVEAGTE